MVMRVTLVVVLIAAMLCLGGGTTYKEGVSTYGGSYVLATGAGGGSGGADLPPTITSATAICYSGSQVGLYVADEPVYYQYRTMVTGGSWSTWSAWSSTLALDNGFATNYPAGQGDRWFFEVNVKDEGGNLGTNNGLGDSFLWGFAGACP